MSSIYFVPNKGQYPSTVLYTFNTREAQMLVFKDRIRLIALHKQSFKNKEEEKAVWPKEKHIVDIKFKGSNELSPIEITNNESPIFNYFTSNANATNIKAASEVRFENVYKGISLRLYSNKAGSLEFDWLISSAADYKKIMMSFEGQDFLHVNKKGALEVGLRFGTLKLDIPQTYQLTKNDKRIPIKNRFVLSGVNTAMYSLTGKVDSRMPLVIDPVLIWGSLMDGNSANFDAYMFGGAKDAIGDLYVCGGSQNITNTNIQSVSYGSPSAGIIATPPSGCCGFATGANGEGVDWLIMKIKGDGSAVLTYTFFGLSSTQANPNLEQAHCISISPNGGSIFVGGICNSSTAIVAQGTLPALSAAYTANTAFGGTASTTSSMPTVAVFTSDLASLKYRTFIGNSNSGISGDIPSIEALNDNDFIVASYVSGSLGNGAGGVPYANGPDNSYAGNNDVYIAKFTNFNTRAWGTYIGGNGDDEVFDMRLLSTGDVAFCGKFTSTVATTTTLVNEVATTTNRNGSTSTSDGMVGVLKSDGSAFNMLSMVGGSKADQFSGLDIGNCDTLYLVGTTSSTNYPNIGVGVMQTTNTGTGTSAMILFKCAASGGTAGTTASYYGGASSGKQDIANSIVYLPTGKLFIFGSTESSTGLNPANNIAGNTYYNATFQGGTPQAWDMFFIECSNDLKTKYLATYVGGDGADYLGNTGVQVTGKQTVLLSDSSIGIFTTTHSTVASFLPNVISASGVFDNTKSNGNNDSWIMIDLNVQDLFVDIDAGDAPISYGKATTLIATSGANATITLGNRVDADVYYPPSPGTGANYDDNEGNGSPRKTATAIYYDVGASGSTLANDEDALTTPIPSILTTNTTYSLTVPFYNNSGQTCSIYGYIDFNRDGSFTGPNEMQSMTGLLSNANAAGTAGRTATLTWTLPGGVSIGASYLRLVIVQGTGSPALTGCSNGLNNSRNQALGVGEVEDYPVTISTPLPLTLLSFHVARQNNLAFLSWQTTNEVNIADFDLQRSTDAINFVSIHQNAGTNSNVYINNYTYTDDISNIPSGILYYRLKIIDQDGGYTYSPIVKLDNNSSGVFSITAVPNPFTEKLIVNISSPSNQNSTMILSDASGRLVARRSLLLKKGDTILALDEATQIPKGLYFLTITGELSGQTLKLIKQ